MQALVTYLNTLPTPDLKRIADSWGAVLPERLYQGNAHQLMQEMTGDYLLRRQVARLDRDALALLALFCQKPDFTYLLTDAAALIRPGAFDVQATVNRLRDSALLFYERSKAEAVTDVAKRFGLSALPKNTLPALQTIKYVVPREMARPLRRIITERLGSDPALADLVLNALSVPGRSPDAEPLSTIRQGIARARTGVRPSGQPLARLLNTLEIDLLEVKSEIWGIYNPSSDSNRNSLVTALVAALNTADEQQRFVSDHLSVEQGRLFETLTKRGRVGRAELLDTYHSESRLARALRPLVDALLVWESFEEGGAEIVFVPQEIATPRRDDSRPRVALQTVTPPTIVTHIPVFALAWDCLTFLNFVRQNEIELTTTNNTIPKRFTKKLLEQMWTGPLGAVNSVPGEITALANESAPKTRKRKTTPTEPAATITVNGRTIDLDEYRDAMATQRLDFAVALSGLLELYSLDDRKLVEGPNLADFLTHDFPEQMRRLLVAWISHPWRAGPINYPYYYARSDVIVKANKTIAGWLEECDVDVWYSLESLVAKVHQTDPFYFRSRRELMQQFDARIVEEIGKSWLSQEGFIIRQTFNTLFEWLGMVRVGRDDNQQPIAFSLTAQGRWLVQFLKNMPLAALQDDSTPLVVFDDVVIPRPTRADATDNRPTIDAALAASAGVRPPSPDMGAHKSLLVQPNFEMLYFAPLPASLWTLIQFADPLRLDQVAIFSLNRSAFLRGLAGGLTPDAITAFLNERSQQPLTDNVTISLNDWARNFKQVHISRATLLETDDPAVLDELEKLALTKALFVRRVSATAALIELPGETDATAALPSYYGYGMARSFDYDDKIKSLRNKLKAAGYFSR